MSEYNIYFENNPVRGKIWIRSLPTRYYLDSIDEKIGIKITGPSLMRYSKLYDYDPFKQARMDHKTFEELQYIDMRDEQNTGKKQIAH